MAEVLAVHDQHDETGQHDVSDHHGQSERFDEAFWNERIVARIDWVHADLIGWDPRLARYDLVSSQYIHLPPAPREALFRTLAGAVAPGGSLLIVGHHPSDLQTTMPRPPMPELFFTGQDIAGVLGPADWTVITDQAPQRSAPDPDGRPVMIRDTVFRARRGG